VSPPINGVATSITAFIGSALRGPTELPGSVNSFNDFERLYGGLWAPSRLGYAVQQFFLNGGSQALIVRVEGDGAGGITDADIIASLPTLEQADLFNLLCIPPLKRPWRRRRQAGLGRRHCLCQIAARLCHCRSRGTLGHGRRCSQRGHRADERRDSRG
jgi:hypothetical protein